MPAGIWKREVVLCDDVLTTGATLFGYAAALRSADAASVRSIGLAGMRERAQLVGGGFSISGAAGAGTTVRAQVPRRVTVSA